MLLLASRTLLLARREFFLMRLVVQFVLFHSCGFYGHPISFVSPPGTIAVVTFWPRGAILGDLCRWCVFNLLSLFRLNRRPLNFSLSGGLLALFMIAERVQSLLVGVAQCSVVRLVRLAFHYPAPTDLRG